MTALLAVERAKPGDVFTSPGYDAAAAESKINLRKGERMRVDDLLEALLLESANDAAATIAVGVSGDRRRFVAAMNGRARSLGLKGTSYANPIGLDDPLNYSTATDLAALARRLLRDEPLARLVNEPSAVLESGARRRVVNNRNDLVARFPFVDGVKTGYTRRAGNVLVGSATGPLGARVISVVLGEPSEAARDADTLALLRYGLAQFRREKALDAEKPVASAAVKYRDERAQLVPAQDHLLVVRRGERITTRVDAPDQLEGELAAGTRVGRIAVLKDGKVVKRVALVTAAEVPGAGPLRVIVEELGGVLITFLFLGILTMAGWVALGIQSRRRARRLAARRRERQRARARAESG
jgi:D-alanyl-D-alanine carboxypeptidase (penicillin-binding protein 5/6)